ncbi:iron-containing redox enzyme family protein [Polyangium sp. y55x31]|uniref:iron-containing redox enzyme family protein n=1 Tax=Polyangium sp. y55x31 TaxID=3042688 RepID=UPI00248231C4|nr:iron-containing redox enzyme family protein [Polyangium sp. y55x31]MDI1477720.1 iron-containing redox enzyme family protein [Polyangium sp. y55x31]
MPPSSRAPAFVMTPEGSNNPDRKGAEAALHNLKQAQAEHPFWRNRFFKACTAGHLTKADFQFFFGQYYLYNRNFTRYLAALMANADNDYHRARLSENLWEEGGGQETDKRHAEIFRKFLRDGLEIDIDKTDYLDATRFFVREFLDFCLRSHPAAGSSFLSLGTEGIVSRMYTIMVEGMLKAGIPEEFLTFFRIHIGCDDEHAATLEDMMLSYMHTPDWYNTCLSSMNYALSLRHRFFESLYDAIQGRKLQGVLSRIQARRSLAPQYPDPSLIRFSSGQQGAPLYENETERQNVKVAVERIPFKSEIIDTRIVRIPPGKLNERHKHAHEMILHIAAGTGRVQVNESTVDVKAGDTVFVPRWSLHQTQNTGDGELVMLAFTDYGLTRRAYQNEPSPARPAPRKEEGVVAQAVADAEE